MWYERCCPFAAVPVFQEARTITARNAAILSTKIPGIETKVTTLHAIEFGRKLPVMAGNVGNKAKLSKTLLCFSWLLSSRRPLSRFA